MGKKKVSFEDSLLCLKRQIEEGTEVRESLGKTDSVKSKEELKLEGKLGEWLDSHSIPQTMDWFDCDETTSVSTEFAKMRWSTESTAKDRLLLKKLGVTNE